METLLKKHEAFERAAATQEERFLALERITTVSEASLFLCLYFSQTFSCDTGIASLHFNTEDDGSSNTP